MHKCAFMHNHRIPRHSMLSKSLTQRWLDYPSWLEQQKQKYKW